MSIRDESNDKSRLEFAGSFTLYSFYSLLILQIVICMLTKNRCNSSFAIWYNISYLQIIQWVNLMKIDPNSEFEAFFKPISIFFRPIKIEYGCWDESLNESGFETVQIHSSWIISNAQAMLIFYVGVLFLCLFLISMNIYNNIEILTNLMRVVKYSMIIRIHLLFFLDLMIFSMINIKFLTGDSSCSTMNFVFSIIFVTINVSFLLVLPLIIKNTVKVSENTNFELISQPFETLFSEFAPSSSQLNFQYYTIYLIHRFTLSFTLINFENVLYLQLFVIITFQLAISNSYSVYYIFKVNPYKCQIDTKTTLISESLTLILFTIFWIRALNFGPDFNYYLTVICVLIIWITEMCNITKFLFVLKRIKKSIEGIQIVTQVTKTMKSQDASDVNESKKKNIGWVDETNSNHKRVDGEIVKNLNISQFKKNLVDNGGVIRGQKVIFNYPEKRAKDGQQKKF